MMLRMVLQTVPDQPNGAKVPFQGTHDTDGQQCCHDWCMKKRPRSLWSNRGETEVAWDAWGGRGSNLREPCWP
eukprot:10630175-Prorocentrum_lima.AAC.1